eukprot:CAMPEP_0202869436 /NCGR_PEP_ID=MMETSP1391-20130828/12448_1 /ASSEMBLY_ACC=CAM_ASM_000867 /TAXON_ID=1034604 /ORGANISM="Chlamydomonas leiostraca, Strain SAG 11-49" /LENGTH=253 /DNA_ID=CAMNT_0049549749 /DNA_START=17 /DNA_END=781 /DNA_ORIENTATION=-
MVANASFLGHRGPPCPGLPASCPSSTWCKLPVSPGTLLPPPAPGTEPAQHAGGGQPRNTVHSTGKLVPRAHIAALPACVETLPAGRCAAAATVSKYVLMHMAQISIHLLAVIRHCMMNTCDATPQCMQHRQSEAPPHTVNSLGEHRAVTAAEEQQQLRRAAAQPLHAGQAPAPEPPNKTLRTDPCCQIEPACSVPETRSAPAAAQVLQQAHLITLPQLIHHLNDAPPQATSMGAPSTLPSDAVQKHGAHDNSA